LFLFAIICAKNISIAQLCKYFLYKFYLKINFASLDYLLLIIGITDKQKKEISDFIKADKKRISEIKTRKTKSTNRQKGIAKTEV